MSLLYSRKITSFLSTLLTQAKKILKEELCLRVFGGRFSYHSMSYPLQFVVFDNRRILGYFNPEFYEIGIHKYWMSHSSSTDLQNLLRHEIAHYIVYIEHGSQVADHGKEFLAVCQRYGWGREVSQSTWENENVTLLADSSEHPSKLAGKVKKLLALAESSEGYESEQATLKANALIVKYNITLWEGFENEEIFCIKRLLSFKKSSPKIDCISRILRTFLVKPVINQGQSSSYLEVFGQRENVCVAEYICHRLDKELETLWLKAKLRHPHLKGLGHKNAFLRGVAHGYCTKQEKSTHTLPLSEQKALIHLDKHLDLSAGLAYPHLRARHTRYKDYREATQAGKQAGSDLVIEKGLENKKLKYLN